MHIVFLSYLCLINLAGFVLMFTDKRRAVRNEWRIPEARLFLIALLGGEAGCMLGMVLFRHKIRKRHFVYGMPLLLLVHLVLAVWTRLL